MGDMDDRLLYTVTRLAMARGEVELAACFIQSIGFEAISSSSTSHRRKTRWTLKSVQTVDGATVSERMA
jgi:hypothetical protein